MRKEPLNLNYPNVAVVFKDKSVFNDFLFKNQNKQENYIPIQTEENIYGRFFKRVEYLREWSELDNFAYIKYLCTIKTKNIEP